MHEKQTFPHPLSFGFPETAMITHLLSDKHILTHCERCGNLVLCGLGSGPGERPCTNDKTRQEI